MKEEENWLYFQDKNIIQMGLWDEFYKFKSMNKKRRGPSVFSFRTEEGSLDLKILF
jgi:hypothetical protein